MSAETVRGHLQRIDNYDFEHFIADLWERQGWSCEVSQVSNDAGIDITATKSTPYPQKKLIQAKRYGSNTTVGGPDIQQYASLKHQQPDADSVVVVTSSSFTRSAQDRARELNVKLVDGGDLADLIDRLDAQDLLETYLPEYGQYRASSDMNEIGEQLSPDDTKVGSIGGGESDGDLREGDGILSPNSSPDWLYKLERSRQWHRLVPVGIVLWLGAVFLAAILEGTVSLVADLIGYGVVWPLLIAIPLTWYLDMRYVRAEVEWSPTALKYIGSSLLLGPLPLLYYYYKRYKTIGL